MPRTAEGPLPDEVLDAVLADPRTRQQVEHIREHIIKDAQYFMRMGLEPEGMTQVVMKGLLKRLTDHEADQKGREETDWFASMRRWVQGMGATPEGRCEHCGR